MERRPDVYLELAVDALTKVERFLGDRSERAYLDDDLVQSAVERQLEVAGDALAQLRRDFPNVFARVPDGPIVIAFRNILAHGYATLDPSRVYEAASDRVGVLRAALEALLAEYPERR